MNPYNQTDRAVKRTAWAIFGAVAMLFAASWSVWGAQGPALVDLPRPAVVTFIPVYAATGELTGLSATTTVSVLEAVPSGRIERRTHSMTIDLFDMAMQEVGAGKKRTTYKEIGEDVMAMIMQETQRRFPAPLPVEVTVQNGRPALRN